MFSFLHVIENHSEQWLYCNTIAPFLLSFCIAQACAVYSNETLDG